MNKPIYRLGVILYAIVIAFFGINHFFSGRKMTGAVPVYFPNPIIWIYVTGAALILASIAFVANIQSKLAAYLLFLLLVIFITTIHVPGLLHAVNEESKVAFQINILKDTAMAAGALLIAAKGK